MLKKDELVSEMLLMDEASTGLTKCFGTSLSFVTLFHPEASFHDIPPQSAMSLVLMCTVRSLVSVFFSSASEQLLKTTVPGTHLKTSKIYHI